jgi:hypothetical protein
VVPPNLKARPESHPAPQIFEWTGPPCGERHILIGHDGKRWRVWLGHPVDHNLWDVMFPLKEG